MLFLLMLQLLQKKLGLCFLSFAEFPPSFAAIPTNFRGGVFGEIARERILCARGGVACSVVRAADALRCVLLLREIEGNFQC